MLYFAAQTDPRKKKKNKRNETHVIPTFMPWWLLWITPDASMDGEVGVSGRCHCTVPDNNMLVNVIFSPFNLPQKGYELGEEGSGEWVGTYLSDILDTLEIYGSVANCYVISILKFMANMDGGLTQHHGLRKWEKIVMMMMKGMALTEDIPQQTNLNLKRQT